MKSTSVVRSIEEALRLGRAHSPNLLLYALIDGARYRTLGDRLDREAGLHWQWLLAGTELNDLRQAGPALVRMDQANALIDPAEDHSEKARPSPPIKVEWHFLQRIVYQYCSAEYRKMGLTNLVAFWNPMPGSAEHGDYLEQRNREQRQLDEYYRDNPDLLA
ncbi:DUF4123 domain-containing protein [Stutzerimonas nitrititolerans]|uniref:DUF4123 domain-containing protein n=1 Tax=Stutzerimonas nitrititolerans TaxID=2482751 RepID=UPI00289A7485|nr:DUF4123 domain-containing protein [Stutzerimonas nitrititolerans]